MKPRVGLEPPDSFLTFSSLRIIFSSSYWPYVSSWGRTIFQTPPYTRWKDSPLLADEPSSSLGVPELKYSFFLSPLPSFLASSSPAASSCSPENNEFLHLPSYSFPFQCHRCSMSFFRRGFSHFSLSPYLFPLSNHLFWFDTFFFFPLYSVPSSSSLWIVPW